MESVEWIVGPAPLDGSPADDQAVSRSLLDAVAARRIAGGVRIWRPVAALALTRLDGRRPGAAQAIALAERAGLPAVVRESGGHAVLLGPGSFAVGVAEPASSFEGTSDRYARLGDALVAALRGVGVHAEQGGLDGEWCPGPWSIRSGTVKLAGLAQRALKDAAWVEAVVELDPNPRARELLPPIYAALGLPLEPATIGSVSELAGRPLSFEQVAEPLAAEIERAWWPPRSGT